MAEAGAAAQLDFERTFNMTDDVQRRMVKALLDGNQYTKLDNLHKNTPLREYILSIWKTHQFAYGKSRIDEDLLQLMQFVHAHLHPELRLWVEEPTDNDIDTWTANAQKKCEMMREKLYEDIELGVLSLPKCCAAKKCEGAEERIALVSPFNSNRADWGLER